jgi:DNA-binding beta-propeller fold protein YncE
MKKIIFLVLIISIAAGCTSDEKIINNIETSSSVLVAVNDGLPRISLYNMEGESVTTDDVIPENYRILPGSKITAFKEYRNRLYIAVPAENRIIALNINDFSLAYNIDFSETGFEPYDFCFPNATDCYVTDRADARAAIIDLTNHEIARYFPLSGKAEKIDSYGNQVYAVLKEANKVSIIDTRFRSEQVALDVAPRPVFVRFTAEKNEGLVISEGYGKGETEEAPSPAMVTYFNTQTREKLSEIELGFGGFDPLLQKPYGLAVTPREWGYVPTGEALFRLDTKNRDRVNLVIKKEYLFIYYHFPTQLIYLVEKSGGLTKLITAEQNSGDLLEDFIIPEGSEIILPL